MYLYTNASKLICRHKSVLLKFNAERTFSGLESPPFPFGYSFCLFVLKITCLAKNVRALIQENMHMPSWVCDPIPLSSAANIFQTTLPKSYSNRRLLKCIFVFSGYELLISMLLHNITLRMTLRYYKQELLIINMHIYPKKSTLLKFSEQYCSLRAVH